MSVKELYSASRRTLNMILFVVVPFVSVAYLLYKNNERMQANYVQEQQTTCPSLLSIARSARDTLIVMRDKSMCTEYMLDNLK